MYVFDFKSKYLNVKFTLVGRISLLEGDSGIGKSYVFNTLKTLANSRMYHDQLKDLIFISNLGEVGMIHSLVEQYKDRLILVDNIEFLAYDFQFLKDLTKLAYNNHILVIGRGRLPLEVHLSDILHLEIEGNNFLLLPEEFYQ